MAFKTLGVTKIKVKKKPNILFFSTGNEISDKDNIPDWKVRNSNCHYIKNLNQNFLFNFKNGGILRDNHEKIFKSKVNKVLKSITNACTIHSATIKVTIGIIALPKLDFINA